MGSKQSRKDLAEEPERPLPRVGRGVRVVDLRTGVVEEGVTTVRIDVQLDLLAEPLQLLGELTAALRRHALIILTIDEQERRLDGRPVDLQLLDAAVEADSPPDVLLPAGCV